MIACCELVRVHFGLGPGLGPPPSSHEFFMFGVLSFESRCPELWYGMTRRLDAGEPKNEADSRPPSFPLRFGNEKRPCGPSRERPETN